MHRIAAALLERETIDAEEVKMLIEGRELPPMRSVLAFAQRQGRRRHSAGAEAGKHAVDQAFRRVASPA